MDATLTSILDLTDRVQAAIDDGDWLGASELESTRRSLLETYLATTHARAGAVETREVIGRLNERNQQLIGTVHHHRRRVLRDASMIRTGQAAVDAYGATRSET